MELQYQLRAKLFKIKNPILPTAINPERLQMINKIKAVIADIINIFVNSLNASLCLLYCLGISKGTRKIHNKNPAILLNKA